MPASSLVLGLGNDLLSDDGFGPAVAEACRDQFANQEDVAVQSASVAGLHLLDLLAGFRRVLIVDVVRTERYPPGTLLEWPVDQASAGRTLGGSHQTDLATTLELGRQLGVALPTVVRLLVAEASDLETIREELTPELARAVPRAVEKVRGWILTDGLTLDEPPESCHGSQTNL